MRQLVALGERLHEHRGVWWRGQPHPYYKPAIEFEPLVPRAAKPAAHAALAGYSHIVPDGMPFNGTKAYMVRSSDGGCTFELSSLEKKKRNQVRKGLRECDVRRVTDIDSDLEALRQINVSVRVRTGVGLSATHYTEHGVEWASGLRRRFALPGHDWWGAYVGGVLAGYYYGYAVGTTMLIDTAKVHSDALCHCASDALLFRLTEDAFNEKGCRRIIFGGHAPGDPDLTRFKEAHGYRRVEFPVYWSPAARLARTIGRLVGRVPQ